ncbi:MAG: hypothetical protein JWQ43_3175 [Glaciihabitans sp.]|nr:hypothetical protein [Glaciihabitans sp.]
MAKVIARIILESEDWEPSLSALDDHPLVQVRRVITAHAHPFGDHELNFGLGAAGDQFFV